MAVTRGTKSKVSIVWKSRCFVDYADRSRHIISIYLPLCIPICAPAAFSCRIIIQPRSFMLCRCSSLPTFHANKEKHRMCHGNLSPINFFSLAPVYAGICASSFSSPNSKLMSLSSTTMSQRRAGITNPSHIGHLLNRCKVLAENSCLVLLQKEFCLLKVVKIGKRGVSLNLLLRVVRGGLPAHSGICNTHGSGVCRSLEVV